LHFYTDFGPLVTSSACWHLINNRRQHLNEIYSSCSQGKQIWSSKTGMSSKRSGSQKKDSRPSLTRQSGASTPPIVAFFLLPAATACPHLLFSAQQALGRQKISLCQPQCTRSPPTPLIASARSPTLTLGLMSYGLNRITPTGGSALDIAAAHPSVADASEAATAVDESGFAVGTRVVIRRLKAQPEFNGCAGKIVSPLENQRWGVELDQGDCIKVSP
jgi:hypothetical protein